MATAYVARGQCLSQMKGKHEWAAQEEASLLGVKSLTLPAAYWVVAHYPNQILSSGDQMLESAKRKQMFWNGFNVILAVSIHTDYLPFLPPTWILHPSPKLLFLFTYRVYVAVGSYYSNRGQKGLSV